MILCICAPTLSCLNWYREGTLSHTSCLSFLQARHRETRTTFLTVGHQPHILESSRSIHTRWVPCPSTRLAIIDVCLPVLSNLAIRFKSLEFLIPRPDVFLSVCLHACLSICLLDQPVTASSGFLVFPLSSCL